MLSHAVACTLSSPERPHTLLSLSYSTTAQASHTRKVVQTKRLITCRWSRSSRHMLDPCSNFLLSASSHQGTSCSDSHAALAAAP